MNWFPLEKEPDPPGGPYQVTLWNTNEQVLVACACGGNVDQIVPYWPVLVHTDDRREFVSCPKCNRMWVKK